MYIKYMFVGKSTNHLFQNVSMKSHNTKKKKIKNSKATQCFIQFFQEANENENRIEYHLKPNLCKNLNK